jgi:hypothetical protein
MKTLFERLKTEHEASFEIALNKYPNTMGEIKKDLQNTYWVADLKFRTAIDFNHYVLVGSFDLMKIFEAFENN